MRFVIVLCKKNGQCTAEAAVNKFNKKLFEMKYLLPFRSQQFGKLIWIE